MGNVSSLKKNEDKRGVFLTFQEMRTLFIRLKKAETTLSNAEKAILLKIEKDLYQDLSIEEAENLMKEIVGN